MRRKLLYGLFSCFAVGICMIMMSGCESKQNQPEKLSAPVVTLTENVASWEANSKADKFEISVSGTLTFVQNTIVSKELENGQSFMLRAVGNGTTTTTSDWSNTVTYTATESQGNTGFTVTWKNGDAVLETDENVASGTIPTYNGTTPVNSEHTSYIFTGWSPEVVGVTENVTYQAQYIDDSIKFTISFYDYDDKLISEGQASYGGTVVPPEAPSRDGYKFTGWDKSFENVKADAKLVAQYTQQFEVKFVDYDDSIIDVQLIDYGKNAVSPSNVTRKNHAFVGWDKSFTNVKSNLVVMAKYVRQYTVTFLNYDDSLIEEIVVNSDANATPPTAPNRSGYTFSGWTGTYENVTSDSIVKANYNVTRYTVTFVYPDGTIISKIENVRYGSSVTAPTPNDVYFNKRELDSDGDGINDMKAMTGYSFTKWEGSTENIIADTIVKAKYGVEITTPIIFIDGAKIEQGTTRATINVYVITPIGTKICGVSAAIVHNENVGLLPDSVTTSSFTNNIEKAYNDETRNYSLSWVYDGTSPKISAGYFSVMGISFDIDANRATGDYYLNLLDSSSLVIEEKVQGEDTTKTVNIKPILISSAITIVEKEE